MSALRNYGWLAVFALFWCGITGAFDFFVVRNLYGQLRAKSFSTTSAVIEHSAVKHDSEGGHGVDIRYRYEVDGKTYQGKRYRYDQSTSSDGAWARAAVKAFPAGATRVVYYNPANPTDAVLKTGLEGSDLFFLMFMTPFNAVGFALLLAPLAPWYRRLRPTELPGIKVMRTGMRTLVRLPSFGPMAAGILTFVGGAFVMIFVVAFTGSGFHPSMEKVSTAWAVIFALAFGMFTWRWIRLQSGLDDLILDPASATVSLPLTHGRKQRVVVPLPQVRAVEVREEVKEDSDSKTTWYDPYLVYSEGMERQEAKLARYSNRESADRLVLWLRQQLSLPERRPEEKI